MKKIYKKMKDIYIKEKLEKFKKLWISMGGKKKTSIREGEKKSMDMTVQWFQNSRITDPLSHERFPSFPSTVR